MPYKVLAKVTGASWFSVTCRPFTSEPVHLCYRLLKPERRLHSLQPLVFLIA